MKREYVIGAVVVALALVVLYLVSRRTAPAPLLDDGTDPSLSTGNDASRIISGVGTGVTGIAASIAEAL